MLGVPAADPLPPKQVRLIWPSVHAVGVMEHPADLDAATQQLSPGCLNVGDDQIQTLRGTRGRSSDVLAKDDRTPGARRRELEDAKIFTIAKIGVETPPKLAVELLRTVQVRNRNDDHLKLSGRCPNTRVMLALAGTRACLTHWIIPSSSRTCNSVGCSVGALPPRSLSVPKNGRPKLPARKAAIHHQLHRVYV